MKISAAIKSPKENMKTERKTKKEEEKESSLEKATWSKSRLLIEK